MRAGRRSRANESSFEAALFPDNWPPATESSLFHPASLLFVLIGMAMVVGGLWVWGQSANWSWTQGAARPEIMSMAIRCAAAGLIVAGEVVWIGLVINRIYPPDGFGRLLQWMGIGAMLVALVSAAALAWAGR